MEAIYGTYISGKYMVERSGTLASYPPLGNYDPVKREIYVLKSVSDRLGLIVHEEVHHALNMGSYSKLKMFEEPVARFYEVSSESNVKPPTLRELNELLGDSAVKERLKDLVNVLSPSEDPKGSGIRKITPVRASYEACRGRRAINIRSRRHHNGKTLYRETQMYV